MAKYLVKTKDSQLVVRVKLSMNEKMNEMQLEYFSQKNIRGLLKAKQKNKRTLEYSGPIGISLYNRLKKPISKYDFWFVMEQIVDMVQKVNSNSLIVSNVVFDIHEVFFNETTKELQFIYLPLEAMRKEADVLAFIDQIIYATQPMQESDMDYVARFVQFIKNMSRFNAEEVEKYISKEDRDVVNTIKRYYGGKSGFITDKPADYYKHYQDKMEEEATGILNEEATGILNEEQTGILNEEATGLLNEQLNQIRYASLYRTFTNETIAINKPVFRVGKERSYSDYFVANNDKVSRNHADFITRNGHFYIRDLNSKNRSFVNGVAIPAQQEIELHNGDNIRLANEEFIFNQ